MRRSLQDRHLPPIVVQGVALLIIAAIAVAAIAQKNSTVMTAILALVGGLVGVGGYFGKVDRHVRDAFSAKEGTADPDEGTT